MYSYWLLPHLSLESENVAQTACMHLFKLLKPAGELVVGPVRHWGFGILSPFRYKGTISYSGKVDREIAVREIVTKTKLWWAARIVQLFSNRYQIHLGAQLVGGKSKRA